MYPIGNYSTENNVLNILRLLSMVVHVYNPSTQKAEAEWLQRFQAQLELQYETLSHNQ